MISLSEVLVIPELERSLELLPRHFADQRPNQANFRGDFRGDFRGELGSPPSKGLDELPAALPEFGCRQPRFLAQCDHFQNAAAGLFRILGKEHRLGDEGVARNGSMGPAQFVQRQNGR